jgi:hypothetical protein
VIGLVCLATPFIHAQPRHERFFGAIGILAWLTTLILPGIVGVKLFGEDLGDTLLLKVLGIIFVVLFGFLLLFIFGKLIIDLSDYASARSALVGQNLEETEPSVLTVRMERDEASIWLRALLFLSSLPERFWFCLEWVLTRGTMNYQWVGTTALGFMLVLAVIEVVGGKSAVEGLGILGDAVMLGATVLLFLPFLAAALVVPILLLVWKAGRLFRAGPLGFGEGLLDNLIFHIRVSDGGAQVFPTARRNVRLWTLRHSQVYEDDFVIAHIADWINRTLAARRQSVAINVSANNALESGQPPSSEGEIGVEGKSGSL